MELLTQMECAWVTAALVFVVLDVVAGNAKGFVTKRWNSSNGWEGIKKKTGLILVIALGIACHVTQMFVDLGFHFPILDFLCGYIIFVEILSVVENVCEIDPRLKTNKFLKFFDFARDGLADDDEEVGKHAA